MCFQALILSSILCTLDSRLDTLVESSQTCPTLAALDWWRLDQDADLNQTASIKCYARYKSYKHCLVTYLVWGLAPPTPATSRASEERDFLWAWDEFVVLIGSSSLASPLSPPGSLCCSCSISLFSWSWAIMKWVLANSQVFLRSLCLFLSNSRSLFTMEDKVKGHR